MRKGGWISVAASAGCRNRSRWFARGFGGSSSDAEYEHECFVDGAELVRVKAPGGTAEPLRINDRRLLDEDAGLLAPEADRRTKARRPGSGRGGRDEDGAEIEELVGLDDHGVTSPALLVPARATRRREAEDLAADHFSWMAAERVLPAAPG